MAKYYIGKDPYFVDANGRRMVRYEVEDKNGRHPVSQSEFNPDGTLNQEMVNLMQMASKKIKVDDNAKKESQVKKETDKIKTSEGTLKTNKNTKEWFKKHKKGIIRGTAVVIAGVLIFVACKGCSKKKYKEDNNSGISYSDEELKNVYITADQFKENVTALSEYLNTFGNKNIKPVDVKEFYYLANSANINNETFKQLVEEGFLPENSTDLLVNSFGVVTDLHDTIALKGLNNEKVDFDYSKMFVDSRTTKVFETTEKKYNDAIKVVNGEEVDNIIVEEGATTREKLQAIGNEQDGYELGENTLGTDIKEFETLVPTQAWLYNAIMTSSIDVYLNSYGVEVGGEARKNRIDDISNVVMSLNNQFACLAVDQTVQKTK